jgi:hypothetical protein
MREVASHLKACSVCQRELARATRLREQLSASLSPLAPSHVPALRALPVSPWSRSWVRVAVAVAAVVVLAVVLKFGSGDLLTARGDQRKLLTRVPGAQGRDVTIYSDGDVLVGGAKLRDDLAAPVRAAFEPDRWPRIQEASATPGASRVRMLTPNPADQAVLEPPRELAWTGPVGTSYVVRLECSSGGGWVAMAGFPRTVDHFSVDLPALEPGARYRWSVTPQSGAGSGWAYLRVVTADDKSRLDYAKQQFGEESTVYASVCASLGLLTRAEEAFAAQVSRHPRQAELTRVLRAVRERMGKGGE